jgi:hypothetical protein
MKTAKSINNIGLIVLIILMLNACKKDPEQGPTGPQGPSGTMLTGNLKGHIFLYDQYGSPILTGLANIKDSMDGTTKFALTDSAGKYIFPGLITGNYNFTVIKSGYGMSKVQNMSFLGGGDINRDIKISQIPSFNATSATATATADVSISINYISDTRSRTFLVFVGKTASVSSLPANYLDVYTITAKAGTITNTPALVIPAGDLYNLGISSGSTAYFAIYGAASNYTASSTFEDLTTGRSVYNAVSTTPATANVVVP